MILVRMSWEVKVEGRFHPLDPRIGSQIEESYHRGESDTTVRNFEGHDVVISLKPRPRLHLANSPARHCTVRRRKDNPSGNVVSPVYKVNDLLASLLKPPPPTHDWYLEATWSTQTFVLDEDQLSKGFPMGRDMYQHLASDVMQYTSRKQVMLQSSSDKSHLICKALGVNSIGVKSEGSSRWEQLHHGQSRPLSPGDGIVLDYRLDSSHGINRESNSFVLRRTVVVDLSDSSDSDNPSNDAASDVGVDANLQCKAASGKRKLEDLNPFQLSDGEPAKRAPGHPVCKYGEKCYRKSANHWREFDHPPSHPSLFYLQEGASEANFPASPATPASSGMTSTTAASSISCASKQTRPVVSDSEEDECTPAALAGHGPCVGNILLNYMFIPRDYVPASDSGTVEPPAAQVTTTMQAKSAGEPEQAASEESISMGASANFPAPPATPASSDVTSTTAASSTSCASYTSTAKGCSFIAGFCFNPSASPSRLSTNKATASTGSKAGSPPAGRTSKQTQAYIYPNYHIVRAPFTYKNGKKYIDPKELPRELPRRELASNFMITINPNKVVRQDMRAIADEAWKCGLSCVEKGLWSGACLTFGPDDEANFGSDVAKDVIKEITFNAVTEVGEKQGRLHAHPIIKIKHYSQIQLYTRGIQREFKDGYNSSLARAKAQEPLLLRGAEIRHCLEIAQHQQPFVQVTLLNTDDYTERMTRYAYKDNQSACPPH